MESNIKFTLYTDGASLGNPGKAGVAFLLYTSEHNLVRKGSGFIGQTTNNVAEYVALICGMQEALKLGARDLVCYSDSELLVRQLKGYYKVRSDSLILFYKLVKHLESLFKTVKFCHIRRNGNEEADKMAKQAAKKGMRGWVTTGSDKLPEESPGTVGDTG